MLAWYARRKQRADRRRHSEVSYGLARKTGARIPPLVYARLARDAWPEAKPVVVDALLCGPKHDRRALLGVLGLPRDPSVVPTVAAFLTAPDPHTRSVAAAVLHHSFALEETFPYLMLAAFDSDPSIQRRALTWLAEAFAPGAMSRARYRALVKRYRKPWPMQAQAFSPFKRHWLQTLGSVHLRDGLTLAPVVRFIDDVREARADRGRLYRFLTWLADLPER